ncbi:hypothetical protein O0I10_009765 [Lichtheimia ornata]|uniref:Uncharacterized protein n=1 Tax=Lichtheimia ornata TaxID=688661 RepID=A0AAD7UWW2_9FUNG|nr:uncharacterized protein O0I10_009765 [Lichtheimia ornata]KAJ8654583.1 hypothetical protein O0I10_009765 [Lichtheimia ornata]
MARLLEDMSVDLFPLRACEGQWGARLIMTEAFRRTSTDTTPKKQTIAESSVSSLGASRLTISQPSTIQEAESSRSGQQRIACTSEHHYHHHHVTYMRQTTHPSDSESAHENEPVQTTAEKVYRDDFEDTNEEDQIENEVEEEEKTNKKLSRLFLLMVVSYKHSANPSH